MASADRPGEHGTTGGEPPETKALEKPSRAEEAALLVNAIGTIIVVALALSLVTVLCLWLVGDIDPSDRAAVLTSAFTVLGTIVGGVTGARVGSMGREHAERAREHAERAREIEALKVQELAARVPDPAWDEAMKKVPERVKELGAAWEGGPGEPRGMVGWGRGGPSGW